MKILFKKKSILIEAKDDFNKIFKSIAYYFIRYSDSVKRVTISKDFIDDFEFKDQLVNSFIEMAIDVIYIGVCNFSLLNFSDNIFFSQASVFIKLLEKDLYEIEIYINKEIISVKDLKLIEEIFYSNQLYKSFIKGTYKSCSIIDLYTDWIFQRFKHLENFDLSINVNSSPVNLKIIKDLFNKLSFKDFSFDKFDCKELNFNINSDKLIISLSNLGKIESDKIAYIFAKDILNKNSSNIILCDVKCSLYLDDMFKKLGARVYRISSNNIVKSLKDYNAVFATEPEKFYFKDSYFGYSDPVYSIFRLIDIIRKSEKKLTDLFKDIDNVYNIKSFKQFFLDI